jgi:16S rRNA (adenine1518-N6/adenine1519-N6)-dimethyltransferase
LRAFLAKHGLGARKGLGQHFLCSPSVVNAIVACLDGFQGALEIGPGPGVLTAAISEAVQKTIALEIDAEMLPALAESAPKAEIKRVDALKADLSSILQELPAPKAVVSNLPYYITGPLLGVIADARSHFSTAVLMMQREVANRIAAPAGDSDRGSLSVFMQAQFHLRKVVDVPKGAFLPPPKVESRVLQFTPTSQSFEHEFFAFVRKGFTQPRKTLANNLVSPRQTRDEVEHALREAALDDRIRPHALTLEQWQALWNLLRTQ